MFHLRDEGLLETTEIGDGPGSDRLEGELQASGALAWLRGVQIVLLHLVSVCLHAWRQTSVFVADFSVATDPHFSLMLVALHHHLEAGDENTPWDILRSELFEHGVIDVLVSEGALTCLLKITLVESKRLAQCLIASKGGFAVLLTALGFTLQDDLVELLS